MHGRLPPDPVKCAGTVKWLAMVSSPQVSVPGTVLFSKGDMEVSVTPAESSGPHTSDLGFSSGCL